MMESKIILSGRFYHGGKFTGPTKVAFRLFNEMRKISPNVEFIEYYFEGKTIAIGKNYLVKKKQYYLGGELSGVLAFSESYLLYCQMK